MSAKGSKLSSDNKPADLKIMSYTLGGEMCCDHCRLLSE